MLLSCSARHPAGLAWALLLTLTLPGSLPSALKPGAPPQDICRAVQVTDADNREAWIKAEAAAHVQDASAPGPLRAGSLPAFAGLGASGRQRH